MPIHVKTPALPFKEKEILPGGTIETWYEKMLGFAHANYEKGWDVFVECYGKGDFRREVEEANLKCYGEVYGYFKEKFTLRQEREREAMMDSGWREEQLCEEMTRAMWDD